MTRRDAVLVLGIGNILWADEGFGVRCVERLAERMIVPEGVRLLDGGTQGLLLVGDLSDAARVLVFDAVDFGGVPAGLSVVRDAAVPAFVAQGKMSLHQAGFSDVLACAALLGGAPARITLIGCQPVELDDYGGSLRPAVAARLDEAVDLACTELAAWGFPPRPRAPGDAPPDVLAPSLALDAYTRGRPSEAAACRLGDARFLAAAQSGAACA